MGQVRRTPKENFCLRAKENIIMEDKEKRLIEREKLREQAKNIDWFSDEVSVEELEEHFQKFLDTYTSDELIEELIECGLELQE